MVISRSIYVAADDIISLFFMADHLSFFNGPLELCVCVGVGVGVGVCVCEGVEGPEGTSWPS